MTMHSGLPRQSIGSFYFFIFRVCDTKIERACGERAEPSPENWELLK